MINIGGMELEDLPEGWAPHGVMVIFRCLDDAGHSRVAMRMSDDWSIWEAAGALSGFAKSVMEDFTNSLISGEEEQ